MAVQPLLAWPGINILPQSPPDVGMGTTGEVMVNSREGGFLNFDSNRIAIALIAIGMLAICDCNRAR